MRAACWMRAFPSPASTLSLLAMLKLHADVLEAYVRAGEADMDNSIIIKEVRRRGVKS